MEIFDSKYSGASQLSWKFHCSLVFDAMTCKCWFVVNFHTNEVVSVAHDCFKTDVICKEIEEVQKYDNNDDGNTEKKQTPDLAMHII
eukprot:5932387-Ditylum_brightwellii.AAC.1